MEILTERIHFNSKGHTDIINLTNHIQDVLTNSNLKEGQITVFAIGSTAGLTTLEYEPGLVKKDVYDLFEKIAPYRQVYAHNKTWGDDNGASHLRSALIGTSLSIPFSEGRLLLGTWQQVVYMDFDTRPRNRQVVVQLLGQSSRPGNSK